MQKLKLLQFPLTFALQGEIAKDLLLSGKHVFMEKPMAVSVEQAQKMVDASKESGKKLMVGYMKRYDAGKRDCQGEDNTIPRNRGTRTTDIRTKSRFRWRLGLQS